MQHCPANGWTGWTHRVVWLNGIQVLCCVWLGHLLIWGCIDAMRNLTLTKSFCTNWIYKKRPISLIYKVLNTTQPPYLYDIISVQPPDSYNRRFPPTLRHSDRSIFITPSDIFHLIFGTRFVHHPESSSTLCIPSHPPSFEHAGLTCYTLPLPDITLSLFHSELLPVHNIFSCTYSTIVSSFIVS